MLSCSTVPLVQAYDTALLDLDGVVYLGPRAIPGVFEALAAAREAGMALAFVTNNASRTPETVAAHLNSLGVTARPDEVITSALAVARLLAALVPAGASVLVVGGDGLRTAVTDAGFTLVSSADDDPAAVAQGLAASTTWANLAEATVAVGRGLPWVAANIDATLPSPRGPLLGNGALVAAVSAVTGRTPIVAGKPEPPLHEEAVRRTGARRPLVVGDRLDTDIAGAVRVDADSLLVLTGVTGAAGLLRATDGERPTYVAAHLGGLLHPHPEPTVADGSARCGGWRAVVTVDGLRLEADPGNSTSGDVDDGLDALRALAVAAWQRPDVAGAPVLATDPGAAAVLDRLGLSQGRR
jgi:glycerol-1-phosphatase